MDRSYSFEGAADLYEESRRVPDDVLATLGRLLTREGCGRWLDVGIGTGRGALPLAAAGASVVGIDLARAMMERMLARMTAGTAVRLVQGDFLRMPFRPGAFDAALGYHVLHLVHDPLPLLREIARVLRPGAPLYYASDQPGTGGNYVALKERYEELVAGRVAFGKPSSRDFGFVARGLDALGARYADVGEGLSWTRVLRRDDLLALFQAKAYSVLFHVPDDVHADVMARLWPWAEATLPAEEEQGFSIRVVRAELPS